MSVDAEKLREAIERLAKNVTDTGFATLDDEDAALIVQGVPLLIEQLEESKRARSLEYLALRIAIDEAENRAELAEAERVEAEKLIGQMAEAFARLPEVEAERDRLAKALERVEAMAEKLALMVPVTWCRAAGDIAQAARDALAGEEQT